MRKTKAVVIDKNTDETIWIRLKKEFFGYTFDLFICVIYIPPPEMSDWSKKNAIHDTFKNLEKDIASFQDKSKVILMGPVMIGVALGRTTH